MPKLTHPATGATWDVPDTAVAYWTGPGGWALAGTAPATQPARSHRPRSARPREPRTAATTTTPAPESGAPDDVLGQGSSTTAHTEE